MDTGEIKNEIQRLLDTVPENVLSELLQYLKEIQKQSRDQMEFSLNLRRILLEDRELLEKLAR